MSNHVQPSNAIITSQQINNQPTMRLAQTTQLIDSPNISALIHTVTRVQMHTGYILNVDIFIQLLHRIIFNKIKSYNFYHKQLHSRLIDSFELTGAGSVHCGCSALPDFFVCLPNTIINWFTSPTTTRYSSAQQKNTGRGLCKYN